VSQNESVREILRNCEAISLNTGIGTSPAALPNGAFRSDIDQNLIQKDLSLDEQGIKVL
jgi:hypothetical protein